ncbi:MAG: tRNA lysidine(34) synthetase TilS, partial [Smithellaceae bacterium]|nr:tRNA lysidine(34) synthetase TilS [Smithellaceae bacterium]
DFIRQRASECLEIILDEKGGRLKLDTLLAQHQAITRRVIKTLLADLFMPRKEATYIHILAVEEFVRRRKPLSEMKVCRDWQIKIKDEYLMIEKYTGASRDAQVKGSGFAYEVRIPGQIRIAETGKIWDFRLIDKSADREHYASQNEILMDYEKIAPPLLLRTRRPGDRIQLQGMRGRKTIKNIFIDQKIPRHHRELVPLLVDHDSVIAVNDGRISERVGVSSRTRLILRIEII